MDKINQQTKKENKSIGAEIGGAIGQEVGAEIGKKVEKHVTGEGKEEKPKKEKKRKSPMMRRIGYAFGIIFSLLFLWIVSNVQNWGWEFITDDWDQVVDLLKFSIYVSIVIYGLFILYDKKLFYYLGRLVMDGVSIYVGIRLFQAFPFDFEYLFGGWGWLNSVFPWLIIIGIAGAGIGIIVRTGKLIVGKNIYE